MIDFFDILLSEVIFYSIISVTTLFFFVAFRKTKLAFFEYKEVAGRFSKGADLKESYWRKWKKFTYFSFSSTLLLVFSVVLFF